ncbi:MAG: type II toxin-antitoxin system VapC family toxin [Gammaproteobacteria bacterium]|nr:type II toxin-antitoxin system VapC family toxin [Gammaproteobacteria bacterium]
MSEYLLDASALLALLHREPGEKKVAETIANATICTVNLAEVIGKLQDTGIPNEAAQTAVETLGLRVVAFDQAMAFEAGRLRVLTRALGLSLGDRACLAAGIVLELPVLTADREWLKLKSKLGLVIEAVR